MAQTFLAFLGAEQLPQHSGGKASQIQQLMKNNVCVPKTYICQWDAFEKQQQDKNGRSHPTPPRINFYH